MKNILDVTDSSLKTVKMGKFEPDTKGRLFKQMLFPYLQLVRGWTELFLGPNYAIPHHDMWTPEAYFKQIHDLLTAMPSDRQNSLLPSRDFSVSAAILSARTDFGRHRPQTLEDTLTLLHQNGLSFLSLFNIQHTPADQIFRSSLPTILKDAILDMSLPQTSITIQRTGIEVNKEQIIAHYNVPINNHSGQIDLIYDIPTARLLFRGKLLGDARNRWPETRKWLDLLDQAQIFPIRGAISQTPQELIFSWDLSHSSLSSAIEEYKQMVFLSNMNTFDWDPLQRWQKSYPDAITKLQDLATRISLSGIEEVYDDMWKNQPITEPLSWDEVKKQLLILFSSSQNYVQNEFSWDVAAQQCPSRVVPSGDKKLQALLKMADTKEARNKLLLLAANTACTAANGIKSAMNLSN